MKSKFNIPGFFRGLAVAAIFILTCFNASGQLITARAELDTNRALIGDQVKLHLSVEKPKNASVHFPDFKDTLSKQIEIISKSPVDSSALPGGRILLKQDLLVTAFDTGTLMIPPITFPFHSGLLHDTIRTTPSFFDVASMPLDSTIRDIKANENTPLSFDEVYPYILALIIIGLIAWALIRYFVKKKAKQPFIFREKPTEPADVIALRELEILRNERLWQQNKVKAYYIRLTEVLRNYIEQRYGIYALEQTSDEILDAIKRTDCEKENVIVLTAILKLADMVKFAKAIPDPDENAIQLDKAVDFVRNTTRLRNLQQAETENKPVTSKEVEV